MKYNIIFSLLALIIVFHTSCSKDNIDTDNTIVNNPPTTTILCDSFFVVNLAFDPISSIITSEIEEGNAPFTYAWSTGEVTPTITPPATANYSLTVTDAEGCTTDNIITVNLGEPCESVSVEITSNSNGTLTAQSFNMLLPLSYLWNTGETTATITPTFNGEYTVLVIDSNGCEAVNSISVSGLCEGFSVAVTEISPGQLDATPTGGIPPYTFVWIQNSTSQTISTSQTTNVTLGGTYTVIVTDNDGCITEESITIADPCNGLDVTISETSPGNLLATPTGGTAPYQYAWSVGSVGPTTFVMMEGTYYVTVVDDNGCTVEDSITIEDPCTIEVELTYVADTQTITATVTGGAPPYTYNWSTGVNTVSTQVEESGTYSISVIDANGCIETKSISI